MNIHCTDKHLFKKLKDSTIVRVLVGSHMYGLNHENSDKDYLNVFLPNSAYYLNPFKNHHQYQFKIDDIDEIFVDVNTFIQNLANGDSTINYECLYDEGFRNSKLKFLKPDMFRSYSIIRSYLGFVKRDIKRIMENPLKKDKHIMRGLEIAGKLIERKEIIMDFSGISNLDIINYKLFCKDASKLEADMRYTLNNMLNDKKIKRYLTAEEQIYIYKEFMKLYDEGEGIISTDRIKFFEANENININYD